MAFLVSDQNIKCIEYTAIVTRADGTVEDLGTIGYWHRNPLRRFTHRLKTLKR